MNTKPHGFTLVELLVVVTIIAVLASLLPSTLSSGKEKANSIKCMENLRQINMRYKIVVDADNGRLGYNSTSTPWTPQVYAQTAQGEWMTKDWGLTNMGWICPNAPEQLPENRLQSTYAFPTQWYPGATRSAWVIDGMWGPWFLPDDDLNKPPHRAGSYAQNNWLGFGWWPNVGKSTDADYQERFRTEGEIQYPSQTPTFADGVNNGYWYEGNLEGPRETDFPATNLRTGGWPPIEMSSFTIPRHGSRPSNLSTNFPMNTELLGAINMAFYDGHAEQVKLERLWVMRWHRNYQIPQKRPGL